MLDFIFLSWFFSFGLGQFGNLFKSSYGGLYVCDFLAVVWVVYSTFYLLINKKTRIFIPKIYFLLLAFLFWNTILYVISSQNFSAEEMILSFFYLFRFVFYAFGILLFYNLCCQNILKEQNMAKLILLEALFLAILGFVQLIIFPDFSKINPNLGWDPHKNRLLGTFFDPNFMGATLVGCVNILLGFWENNAKKKNIHNFWLFLIFLAIFLTFSRSAWLMLTISIFLWGIIKYRGLLAVSILIALLAYLAVPRVQTRISAVTDPADSAHFRLISWKNTWKVAKDSLWIGSGYNTFRFTQKDYGFLGSGLGGHSGGGSDSSLLLILATTGIPGFLFFFSFLCFPWISSVKKILKRQNAFSWDFILFSFMPALLVNSFFINSLFYPPILFLWNLTLGGATLFCIEPSDSSQKCCPPNL